MLSGLHKGQGIEPGHAKCYRQCARTSGTKNRQRRGEGHGGRPSRRNHSSNDPKLLPGLGWSLGRAHWPVPAHAPPGCRIQAQGQKPLASPHAKIINRCWQSKVARCGARSCSGGEGASRAPNHGGSGVTSPAGMPQRLSRSQGHAGHTVQCGMSAVRA